MAATTTLAQHLIQRESVTPEDAGCQKIITDRLTPLGFECKQLDYGDVKNLWAVTKGKGPLLVFAGHTDVVPPGPADKWTHPPFAAEIKDGFLYGRGAADMKGSIAAMIIAVEKVLGEGNISGRLGFLITSDEEGPAVDGTVKVVEHLEENNIKMNWCIVGEPTSTTTLGDIIKNGRRGSLNGHLTVKGKQGHVAYPHLAENPIHQFALALSELTNETWDQGDEYFPPTTFQVSNIQAGTGADNVIPAELTARFNFRFSSQTTDTDLKLRVEDVLKHHRLDYTLDWRLSGNPFITPRGDLVNAITEIVESQGQTKCELSTTGGTSDGRFIAPTGAEVVELGPCNATIHQIDECVSVEDLERLSDIYAGIIKKLLCTA